MSPRLPGGREETDEDEGHRKEQDEDDRSGRERPSRAAPSQLPEKPSGYCHATSSKIRTASSFSSPRSERFTVSASNGPQSWRISAGSTSGFTGYS